MMAASCYRRIGDTARAIQTYRETFKEFPENMECGTGRIICVYCIMGYKNVGGGGVIFSGTKLVKTYPVTPHYLYL